MNLIEKLELALKNKDRSNIVEYEDQAERELAPLKKCGQRFYVNQVESLLDALRELPVEEPIEKVGFVEDRETVVIVNPNAYAKVIIED